MKEVLTKSFWEGVKKTFYEALEEPKPDDKAAPAPEVDTAKTNPETPSASNGQAASK